MTQPVTDVCLVLPPYAALERPSIALGLLKASLRDTGISCRVVHANFLFAEMLGLDEYTGVIEKLGGIVGDWTFAGSLFPSFEPSEDDFFQLMVERRPNGGGMEEPLGDLRSAMCRARGLADSFVDRAAAEILALRPRIVGCSSVLMQHVAALALLQRVRQLAPEVVTMLGGASCEGSRGLATLRAFPFVDYVVSGEADQLFPELCRIALERGTDVAIGELPYGVMSQRSVLEIDEGNIPRAVVRDLNLIPTPEYDDYFEELRRSPVADAIIPTLVAETSRGCWWGEKHRCAFCGLMSGAGIAYRSKDADCVLRDFDTLTTRYGITRIQCVDNVLDHRYLRTLMPALAGEGRGYVLFYETKANLRHSDVELLSNAGVRHIQPGIESLHDEALRALGKGTTAVANVQLLKWALRYGIYLTWNLLIGIPGERDQWYAEMAEIIPLITHLQPPHRPLSPIQFEQYSRYSENAGDFGLDLVPSPGYAFIYPFAEDQRASFANDFQDRNDPFRKVRLHDPSTPGMQALRRAYTLWRRLWSGPFELTERMRPELRMSDDGRTITIIDTRPAAVRLYWELTPLESHIYRCCDRGIPYGVLLNELGATAPEVNAEDVAAAVARLQESKLLACISERYLALAVSDHARPFPDVLPCGVIERRPKPGVGELSSVTSAADSAESPVDGAQRNEQAYSGGAWLPAPVPEGTP